MTDKRKQEEPKQVRKKYTNAMIKKLPPKNHKYYVIDSECGGLRIYVSIAGEISFYLQRYIPEYKYSKRTKIGDFPEMSIAEARKLGKLIKADNVQGKDPILAKAARKKESTFGVVIEEFQTKKLNIKTNKARGKKSLEDEKGQIRAYLLNTSNDAEVKKVWRKYPEEMNIKSKRLSEITTEDVFDYHGAITSKSKYTANKMVRLVRKMFNYSIRKGYFTGKNPASIPKNELNEEMKDHLDYYSTANMKKLIKAAEKLRKQPDKRVACNGILAALYCGGRPPSEAFNLTVDQLDLEKKLIHYKKSKVGQWSRPINDTMVNHFKYILELRSKGDPVHYYPKEDLRHRYLFPNCRMGQLRRTKRGLKPCKLKHIKEVRKVWKQIKKLAGVEDRDLKSLRHTFAVFCVTCGVSLRALQKMLGHASIQTTEIYAAADPEFLKSESNKISAGFAA
ncbi:MAG: site-specific integrase [Pelagibacterales bacterium]|nr:site-specific integrase [Pelagibacterales bacterium]